MNPNFPTIYTAISLLMALIDLWYAWKSFRHPGPLGRTLGVCALTAASINMTYLVTVHSTSYQMVSVFSSIYFALIDVLLLYVLHFTALFTEMRYKKICKKILTGLRLYAAADCVILFWNIFQEIAIHYVDSGYSFARYTYEMFFLYEAHLVFSYVIVFLILYLLITRLFRAPTEYQNPYWLFALAIFTVVAFNAVYLFKDGISVLNRLDVSILGYSVGLYLMYQAAFNYREKNMPRFLSAAIFSRLDQGIILFDYENKLILHNARAVEMLGSTFFLDRMPREEFLRKCGMEEQAGAFSLQMPRELTRRMDYQPMRNQQGEIIGHLYVLIEDVRSTDPLTGFLRWEYFRALAEQKHIRYEPPTTVVLFDLLQLDRTNRLAGRGIGEKRIANLSRAIRRIMPEDAVLIRGFEATLFAIVPGMEEKDLLPLAEQVLRESQEQAIYGMSTLHESTGGNEYVREGVRVASRSLQKKKLLNVDSAHAQNLSTLVQALKESDSDTEAHVKRTQRMGDELGRRIGLSDSDLSSLQLLCLLHDIGKIGIPLEILNKPGQLNDAEWDVMRTHPRKGYQIAMSADELSDIADMILHHHERWDGKGYPDGLAGEDIPVLSRIIAIVDAYDAMVNNRVYRKALSPAQAREEIRRCAGTQFDPQMAEVFLNMLEENPALGEGDWTGEEEPKGLDAVMSQAVLEARGSTTVVIYTRYLLDEKDDLIETDGEFEKMTGYSQEMVRSMHLNQIDLIPTEERAMYLMMLQEQQGRSNLVYLEHDLLPAKGPAFRVYCMGKRYFDSAARAYRSEIIVIRKQKTSAVSEKAEEDADLNPG